MGRKVVVVCDGCGKPPARTMLSYLTNSNLIISVCRRNPNSWQIDSGYIPQPAAYCLQKALASLTAKLAPENSKITIDTSTPI